MEELHVIPEFPNYSINKKGEVFSMYFKGVLRKEPKKCKEHIDRGYSRVGLYKSGSKTAKTQRVHRLLAKMFLPNPDNLDTVDHIDGDTQNNHLDNLQWMSHKDNVSKGHEKHFKLKHPDWGVIEGVNLTKWAKENGINDTERSSMAHINLGKIKSSKYGWEKA